jgi:hypothetical protein
MAKYTTPFTHWVAGGLLLALSACTPAVQPRSVTIVALPPGEARFATDVTIKIISSFNDVTSATEPTQLDEFKQTALRALENGLGAEELQILPKGSEAPFTMRLELEVRRREPIVGGRANLKAVISTRAGQELFTATSSDGPYMLMHTRDTNIALNKGGEQLAREIIARLQALRAPAS